MKALMLAILAGSIFCAVPSEAQTSSARVVFTDLDGKTINAVDNEYRLGFGQTFKAEVYMTSSVYWSVDTLAFGWGTTDKQGEAATDLSGNFTLTSHDYDHNTFKIGYLDMNTGFSGSGIRPYGNYMCDGSYGYLAPGTEYHVATYTLKNMMSNLKSGTICIYDAGYGTNYRLYQTTTIMTDGGIVSSRPPTVNYTMTSIPEPSSMMAMGCAGVGVLGDLLRRRRKRSSAKK